MTIHDRLTELGIELPSMAAAAGSYLPTVRTGNLLFTASRLPFVDGKLPATGRVGAEVSPEDAKSYARLTGLNLLAAVDAAVGLDAVERVVNVVGFVASARASPGNPGLSTGCRICSRRCSARPVRMRAPRWGSPSCRSVRR